MTDDPDNFRCRGGFSSPPCYAADVAPDYFDPLAVDPDQARDVARWRKAERARLRIERQEIAVADRQAIGAALIAHLREVLKERFGGPRLLGILADQGRAGPAPADGRT